MTAALKLVAAGIRFALGAAALAGLVFAGITGDTALAVMFGTFVVVETIEGRTARIETRR